MATQDPYTQDCQTIQVKPIPPTRALSSTGSRRRSGLFVILYLKLFFCACVVVYRRLKGEQTVTTRPLRSFRCGQGERAWKNSDMVGSRESWRVDDGSCESGCTLSLRILPRGIHLRLVNAALCSSRIVQPFFLRPMQVAQSLILISQCRSRSVEQAGNLRRKQDLAPAAV